MNDLLGVSPVSFAILDALDSGAVVLDAEHRIRHWNAWIAWASGLPAETTLGRPLWDVFPALRESRLRDAVEDALTVGLLSQMSDALNGRIFPLRLPGGGPLLHNVVIRRLDCRPEPHCLIQVHDVTARRRAETALRRSERRARDQLQELETLYRTAPIGLALLDRDLRFLRINEALADITGVSVSENLGRCAWEAIPSLRDAAEPLIHHVFQTGEEVHGIEWHGTATRDTGDERHWIADLYPLKAADETVAAVGTIIREVTEQRRLEERERLLSSELRHRIKNMLAMVHALATRTAERSASVAEFETNLKVRLKALGAAQDLLLEGSWGSAVNLPALALRALAPHLDLEGRLQLRLEDVPVPPGLATSLALALHELATNAAKYGALSERGGRVLLQGWVKEVPGSGTELRLDWREEGGPPVSAPDRKGFGMRLLERALTAQHGGQVEIDWREQGLVCRITLPLGADSP